MIQVTLYTREDCPACDQARDDLAALQEVIPHELKIVLVNNETGADAGKKERIGLKLPVVEVGPYHLNPPFTRQDLQILLSAARDRGEQVARADSSVYQMDEEGRGLPASDRLTYFFSAHYLAMANILLLLYVGLPFLAPVFMKNGSTLPASIIYKIYSPMCHQLAFRSWFLFGEQAFYPRALAGITNVIPYETIAGPQAQDVLAARAFTGNPVVGYKVALCERDVAIYAFMLLFGLFFAVTGRKLRSMPWYVWVIVGLGPIGLDGFSQLPSLASGLPAWLPLRESTPLLRTLTGGLFGWMTAWYLFPMLEETSREARQIVRRKISVLQRDESLPPR